MPRRLPALLTMALSLVAGGCARDEPTTSREVTPGTSRTTSTSSLVADPNAATRPPRAIATH